MADEKTLGFSIVINGVSVEAAELQKLTIQLQNLNKEYKDLQKTIQQQGGLASNNQIQQLAAYSKEINTHKDSINNLKKVVDSAPDSLNRMRAELIRAKDAAADCSATIRDRMTPYIKEMSDEVQRAETAMGSNSRNVGNYGSAFVDLGQKIKDSFVQLAAGGAIIALATKLFEGMKEAILSTSFGIDQMNKLVTISKQLFYDLATTGSINMQNLKDASAVQDKFNSLRLENYKIEFQNSKLNKELQADRLAASDQNKTLEERLTLLNRVEEINNQERDAKVKLLRAELTATYDLLQLQPGNEKLQIKALELMTQINNTYAEADQAMKRVETTRTGFIKKEYDDRKKEYDDLMKLADEQIKLDQENADKERQLKEELANYEIQLRERGFKLLQDEWKKEVDGEKATNDFRMKEMQLFGIKQKDLGLQHNKDLDKQQTEREKSAKEEYDYDLRIARKRAMDIANVTSQLSTIIGQFASGQIKSFKELSKEILKIALEAVQKQILITQVEILAKDIATKSFAGIATAAAKIALIQLAFAGAEAAVEKFQYGGKINRGIPINTGTVDDRLIAVNRTETVLTQAHVARLGGSGVMHQIGVPGYAMGGYVGSQTPHIAPAGFNASELERVFSNRIDRLEVRLDTNKVRSSLHEVELINTTNKL